MLKLIFFSNKFLMKFKKNLHDSSDKKTYRTGTYIFFDHFFKIIYVCFLLDIGSRISNFSMGRRLNLEKNRHFLRILVPTNATPTLKTNTIKLNIKLHY